MRFRVSGVRARLVEAFLHRRDLLQEFRPGLHTHETGSQVGIPDGVPRGNGMLEEKLGTEGVGNMVVTPEHASRVTGAPRFNFFSMIVRPS